MVTKAWTVCFSIRERKSSRRRVFKLTSKRSGRSPTFIWKTLRFHSFRRTSLSLYFVPKHKDLKEQALSLYFVPKHKDLLINCIIVPKGKVIYRFGKEHTAVIFIRCLESQRLDLLLAVICIYHFMNKIQMELLGFICRFGMLRWIVTSEEQCLALVTPLAELLSLHLKNNA